MGLGKKILEAVRNGKMTDLELTLIDTKGNIKKMAVHKLVLYVSCKYFQTMFDSEFDDKNKKELVLRDVPDVNVFHDIIREFYGDKTTDSVHSVWRYNCEKIKCKKYLMMDVPVYQLCKYGVPDGEYDELLNIVDKYFGYTKKTIKLLVNELPANYDLDKLSAELVKAMYDYVNGLSVATIDVNGCLNIFDMYGEKSRPKKIKGKYVNACCFNNNNNIVILYDEGNGTGNIIDYGLISQHVNNQHNYQFKQPKTDGYNIHPICDGRFFLLKDGSSINKFDIRLEEECYYPVNTKGNHDNSYSIDPVKNRLAVIQTNSYIDECTICIYKITCADLQYLMLLNIPLDRIDTKLFLFLNVDILITCIPTQFTLWNVKKQSKYHVIETEKKILSFHFFSKYRFMVVFDDGSAKFYGDEQSFGTNTDIDPLDYWEKYDFRCFQILPNFHPGIKGVCDGTNLVTYDDICIKIWDKIAMKPSTIIDHGGNIQKVVCQNSPRHKNTEKLCKFLHEKNN